MYQLFEKKSNVNRSTSIHFDDSKNTHTVYIRNGQKVAGIFETLSRILVIESAMIQCDYISIYLSIYSFKNTKCVSACKYTVYLGI